MHLPTSSYAFASRHFIREARGKRKKIASRPSDVEIDEPSLHIHASQLNRDPIAHVEAALAADHPSLDVRRERPDVRALRRRAGHGRIEAPADPVGNEHRRGRLSHLSFDTVRVVFPPRAEAGQLDERLYRIGRGLTPKHSLEKPLREQVRVTPMRGGGVRVVTRPSG